MQLSELPQVTSEEATQVLKAVTTGATSGTLLENKLALVHATQTLIQYGIQFAGRQSGGQLVFGATNDVDVETAAAEALAALDPDGQASVREQPVAASGIGGVIGSIVLRKVIDMLVEKLQGTGFEQAIRDLINELLNQ